jgi:hypothetical protein
MSCHTVSFSYCARSLLVCRRKRCEAGAQHAVSTQQKRTVACNVPLRDAQESFAGGPTGGKKRRLAGSAAARPVDALSFAGVAKGKPRSEACRWFFELLVLKSRGYVELEQEEPYADIQIRPRPKLLV